MNPERICYGCFTEKEPGIPCPHCGFREQDAMPYLALPLGTILNGRYLTGKVLGIGGFGITYLAYDLTLECKVAIKEYMPSALAARDPDHYSVVLTGRVEKDYQYGMDRFLEEARILARLQSTPHIVSVQNYFKENGTAYFVMEYIDGMSLKAYLEQNGDRISCEQTIAILKPVMEALVQVHAMNLLHRDISPDNIYITAKGESRLLDFGAARFALGDGKSVSVILKHGYAPEEQYSNHGNQGPWTDVYAMGATMYRCITGQLPPDSVERLHNDTIKMPSELGIHIPSSVENAMMKALAVKSEDRFPNMEAFIRALSGSRSVFSGMASYIRANPVIGLFAGGGLIAAITLCIVIPIVLSGKGGTNAKTDTTGGGGGAGGVSAIGQPAIGLLPEDPASVPGQDGTDSSEEPGDTETLEDTDLSGGASAASEVRDLGVLNATIEIPSDYRALEDGFSFINEEKSCAVTLNYIWNLDGPIYSLSDVESQREEIVGMLMQSLEITDYQILTAGPDQVGNSEGYQIYATGTDSHGDSMNVISMAVEGYDFGCYFIIGVCPRGEEDTESQMQSIIRSFRSSGMPKLNCTAYYAERAGVKVIIEDSLVQGGVADVAIPVSGLGTVYEMYLYPSEEDRNAGIVDGFAVEIGRASDYGLETPEEVIDYNRSISGSREEVYTFSSGGVEWTACDFTVEERMFSYSAAMIDGECLFVGCVFHDSNKDAVVNLYHQVLASLRTWEET